MMLAFCFTEGVTKDKTSDNRTEFAFGMFTGIFWWVDFTNFVGCFFIRNMWYISYNLWVFSCFHAQIKMNSPNGNDKLLLHDLILQNNSHV